VDVDLVLDQFAAGSFPDLTLDIFATDAFGAPTGASLSSTTIPASTVPQGFARWDWVSVTLATPIPGPS
jgi:hypothetical protein